MQETANIYSSIFNVLPEHVALLDKYGTIQLVNEAWLEYGRVNDADEPRSGLGQNYLEVCDSACRAGSHDARLVAGGLRDLLDNGKADFGHDYPCHSPRGDQWFNVRCMRLIHDDQSFVVVLHQDVTEQTLLHATYQEQALTDSLTGLANRRAFDQILNQQWRRDLRTGTPLSLIMLDVDFFKRFNDRYGHVAGDECLKKIAEVLQSFARRPGDLAVRYGGEEFLLVLGSTPLDSALVLAESLCASIRKLNIINEGSSIASTITASLGVASLFPRKGLSESVLLPLADQALYIAKNAGRNTVAKTNVRFI